MFMIVFGLIFLVVGVIMLAGGLAGSGASAGGFGALLGLGITGVVFAVVGLIFTIIGVVMRRRQVRQDRIRREGAAGTATITDIRETNMTVNDRPVLKLSLHVSVPGQSPYAVQKRMTMPWNALGRLAVGATLPVMVDRSDPDEVVIDWEAAPTMGTSVGFGSGIDITGPMAPMVGTAAAHQAGPTHPGTPALAVQGQRVPIRATVPPPQAATLDLRADEAELRQTGLPARATIRGAEDLGVGGRGSRLVRLELDVEPTGRTGYPLQHVTLVPEATMPRLAPGTSLAVRIDPSNPQNLAIDWDGA